MKLLFFNDYRLGLLKDGRVFDVSSVASKVPAAGPHDVINGIIANFDQFKDELNSAAVGDGLALSEVTLRPPLPKPTNVVCMALNYREDGTMLKTPAIDAFAKPPNAVIGPGDKVVLHDVPATVFEGEPELAIVIGKHCENVEEADAMDFVFGYTNLIDWSARGLQDRLGGINLFYQMKSRATGAPIGPCITTKDEISDPQKLQVKLWNNGILMHDFNTDDMHHSIIKCISWVSKIHPLLPGDIIATGTNHRGLHAFQHGDRVVLEIEGCGKLEVGVHDEVQPPRVWPRDTRLERLNAGHVSKNPVIGTPAPQTSGRYVADQGL